LKKTIYLIAIFVGLLTTFTKEAWSQVGTSPQEGLYAEVITSKGKILLLLEFEKVPLTVAHFVGLVEGKIENTAKAKGEPYYDGLIFHRVIPDGIIQGGDPEGTGYGGPGYKFKDEFHSDLKHDRPGTLSMANSGKNTNGSQFFITHRAIPKLDGKHTVFGNVVEGQDVVNAISEGEVMKSIRIFRIGEAAKKFDLTLHFTDKDKKKL